MRNVSRKRLLLIGFFIIILIAIPLTIYLIKQQQDTRSRAEAATILSLEPTSSQQTPIQKTGGDIVNLDVVVDPGVDKNLVSFVRLEIIYDPTKLATGGATPQEKPFAEDTSALALLEGPVYTPGKISATLSVGVDPTKVIQTKKKIATLTFTAIGDTANQATQVTFGPASQVLSTSPADQANENVLSSTINAFIAISGDGGQTTPTPGGQSPTVTTTLTPTPTTIPGGGASPSATPTPTIIGGGGGSANLAPVCAALDVDRSPSGTAPFSITFTARGSDSDDTISKATFAFGDGQVSDITSGGGLGTATVNVTTSHTYQNAGTYTASAILTDGSGGVSSGTCSQTITVSSDSSGSSGSSPTGSTSDPSLPATGPGDTILGIGAALTVLSVIGGILFFLF